MKFVAYRERSLAETEDYVTEGQILLTTLENEKNLIAYIKEEFCQVEDYDGNIFIEGFEDYKREEFEFGEDGIAEIY